MKKLFVSLALVTLLVSMIPGVATATTYTNDVPTGLTLLGWSTTANDSGKDTMINFFYSGGFREPTPIEVPFDSSWHSLDDVRPILLAHQKGYDYDFGGTNGSFGSKIMFSDNVLAAMKIQDFNPSQVTGANIPPSATTLTSDQTVWLQKIGYSVQSTSQSVSTHTTTPTSVSATPSQTKTQSQPQPTQKATSTQTNTTTASTPIQQSKKNTSSTTTPSSPAVGQTVKTLSGPITSEMVAANQKMAAQNPPSLNPANIPIKVPVKKETSTTRNVWIWIAAGVVILVLAAVSGRVLYVRHRKA